MNAFFPQHVSVSTRLAEFLADYNNSKSEHISGTGKNLRTLHFFPESKFDSLCFDLNNNSLQ